MKLENQVVSLELAKKLKELGFEQESLFYHLQNTFGDKKYLGIVDKTGNNPKGGNTYYSAYTVTELLELCPPSTSILKRTDVIGKNPPRYYAENWDTAYSEIYNENPADALAKLLIYLKENNLIN